MLCSVRCLELPPHIAMRSGASLQANRGREDRLTAVSTWYCRARPYRNNTKAVYVMHTLP